MGKNGINNVASCSLNPRPTREFYQYPLNSGLASNLRFQSSYPMT